MDYLPSTKASAATVAAGVASAYLTSVDWDALLIAVVTLVLSYLVPERNPSPSARSVVLAEGTNPTA